MGSSEMRVLLTGSRTWVKHGPVEALMLGMKDSHFILGDNPNGLDAIALSVALKHNLSVEVHTAHWNEQGKSAGHRRNGKMVEAKPNVAFAFKQQAESIGTEDCMRQCVAAGVPVYLITPVDSNTSGMLTVAGTKGYRYNSEHDSE